MSTQLHAVMYHYVRDLPNTPFPRIKGMLTDDFVRQVDALSDRFEMAGLESALAFLDGSYQPSRDLCLLTFDDGVRDHYETAAPILAERGIEGLFFLITGCIADKRVAEVHKNHFLMASLPFDEYRNQFFEALDRLGGQGVRESDSDDAAALRTYVWDEPQIGRFKYFFNFVVDPKLRAGAIAELFESVLGDESSFAEDLYLSWEQAQEMQQTGMTLGGHTDSHRPIAKMPDEQMQADLDSCRRRLEANLLPAPTLPFSYPYGKRDSFNEASVEKLRSQGYDCSFTTEKGANEPGSDVFRLRRVDCKQAPR